MGITIILFHISRAGIVAFKNRKNRLVSATSIVTFIYVSFTMVGDYSILKDDLFSAGFKIKSCITLGEFSEVDLSVLGYYFASLAAFFSWYTEQPQ